MKKGKRERLRKFFTITIAAFDLVETISQTYSGRTYILQTKMRSLHKLALDEVNKENPDMEVINNLLKQMEIETKNNNDK